jgi:hypothetical protein
MNKASALEPTKQIVVYLDAFGRRGQLGAAAVALAKDEHTITLWQTKVGSMENWAVHTTELIDIFNGVSLVYQVAYQKAQQHGAPQKATILSDSTSALQAVRNAGNKSSQGIIYAI